MIVGYCMRKKIVIVILTLMILASSFMISPRPAIAVTSGAYDYILVNNGTGARITAYSGSESVVVIPDTIDGYPVVSIGSYSFASLSGITDVTVPEGVTDIGSCAFYNCTALIKVSLPDSLLDIEYAAFYGCTSLSAIELPEDLVSISGYAFYSCDLTSVTIPRNVTIIGDSVFENCYDLTSVSIAGDLPIIGSGEFARCLNLTSIDIPESVTAIGDGAFYGCLSLTEINIPANVTTIGNAIFQNCHELATVYIMPGVSSIGYAAFYNCTSLASIALPDSVNVLGYSAFYDCISLTSLELGNGIAAIGSLTCCNCISLTAVTIPNSVAIIGYGAFFGCNDLISVDIGSGVTEISSSAFGNCSSLASITFDSDAPVLASDWTSNDDSGLLIYYHPGASGFSGPSWAGFHTEMSEPALAAPKISRMVAGPSSVAISWKVLSGSGSERVDYYIIFQDGVDILHVTSASAVMISGLVNGQVYYFQIAAHGPAGVGLNSTSFRIVPIGGPETLSMIVTSPIGGSFIGSGDFYINWTVVGDPSNISYFEVKVDNGPSVVLSATGLNYKITGIDDGNHSAMVAMVDVRGVKYYSNVTFSVDTTVPTIVEVSPTGTGISTRTAITVRFSETMYRTMTSIMLKGVPGSISWNGTTATFVPSSTLNGNTTFTVAVNGEDMGGNALQDTNWTFSTANVGRISGTIVDAENNPIANAKVTLTRTSSAVAGTDGLTSGTTEISGTIWTTVTDANGDYAFYDLVAGDYALTSSKEGYNTTSSGLTLTVIDIANGGMTFDEKISAQGPAGNDIPMIMIGAIVAALTLVLLAVLLLRRKS